VGDKKRTIRAISSDTRDNKDNTLDNQILTQVFKQTDHYSRYTGFEPCFDYCPNNKSHTSLLLTGNASLDRKNSADESSSRFFREFSRDFSKNRRSFTEGVQGIENRSLTIKMVRRSQRKTTAFIKIVRSPSAANMLRTRKLPPFFKIGVVVMCAYVMWSMNHPDDDDNDQRRSPDYIQHNKRGLENPSAGSQPQIGVASQQQQQQQQIQPQASSLQSSNQAASSVGSAASSSSTGASDSVGGAAPVSGATSEKQQAILESLKRIRWRQQMMSQLQRELFKSGGGAAAAGAPAAAPAATLTQSQQSELPMSLRLAQERLRAAQSSSAPVVPGSNPMGMPMQQQAAMPNSFQMPTGNTMGMNVAPIPSQLLQQAQPVAAAAPAAPAAPDCSNTAGMSLEDMMKYCAGGMAAGGLAAAAPAPAAAPVAHIEAMTVFGRIGEPVPFRTPSPETEYDAKYGKLPSSHFPNCQIQGKSHDVAFLKTHKTGSSTMSNIMLRYADRHNLTVGLPLEGKWELGGYPAFIDKRLIDPELPNYNVLGHHFRFNKEKLDEIMDPATKYITIIRSPVDNVESVFGFFQDQEPFMHWMEEIETTQRLGTFYADPTRFFNHDTDWYMRSKNYMCFDIGYSVEMDDDAIIDQKIAVMEQQLTFVLLTDYFDESLILMKNKLCWDWDDVVYVKFKMRIEEAKATINPTLAEQIKKWNRADFKLYEHFNTTFWANVDAFGRARMAEELEEFRDRQKKAEHECIQAYEPFKKKPWILGAKLRPHPTTRCKQLAWSETVYGEHLREKMYRDVPGLMKPTFDQKVDKQTLFTEVSEGAFRST